MISNPSRHRIAELPPCDGCGLLDAGAWGFGPPDWHSEQAFCEDCTPSRTGSLGLPSGGAGVVGSRAAQADLFGGAL